MDSGMTPTKLMFWNADDDDGRGGGFTEGYYRTAEAAEAEAERRNGQLLKSQNDKIIAKNNTRLAAHREQCAAAATAATEHNVLVEAGLRSGPYEYPLSPDFVPQPLKTKLYIFSYPEKNPTERNSRWGTEDHWYTEAVEFDG